MPSLRAIQAFEAFGRLGSVQAAAAEIGVTPGAVSQQIRKVEEQLGLSLLERRGPAVRLTSWGRSYHREIADGFRRLRLAHDWLEQEREGEEIVISCLPSIASKWLAPQLFDWQVEEYRANIRLIGSETEPVFAQEKVDFRVSYGAPGRALGNVVELFTDRVVPACAPSLLKRLAPRTPEDILALPQLGIEWDRAYGSPPSWADWAKSIGATPPKRSPELVMSLSSAAIDAAINGRGFVLAQLAMAADDIASGRLVVPFAKTLSLPDAYYLAFDRNAFSKPFGRAIHSWIVTIARRQAGLSARNLGKP